MDAGGGGVSTYDRYEAFHLSQKEVCNCVYRVSWVRCGA